MKDLQIVLLGLGGQGILFVSRLLAEAAMEEGREVITSETHGMSQRGGAVESHVKIGAFQSPLVRRGRADATIAFDRSRAQDARTFLAPGGRSFVDEGEASAAAREAGFPKGANVVLLSHAASTAPELFPAWESILAALERLSSPAAREANRTLFKRGRELR